MDAGQVALALFLGLSGSLEGYSLYKLRNCMGDGASIIVALIIICLMAVIAWPTKDMVSGKQFAIIAYMMLGIALGTYYGLCEKTEKKKDENLKRYMSFFIILSNILGSLAFIWYGESSMASWGWVPSEKATSYRSDLTVMTLLMATTFASSAVALHDVKTSTARTMTIVNSIAATLFAYAFYNNTKAGIVKDMESTKGPSATNLAAVYQRGKQAGNKVAETKLERAKLEGMRDALIRR